MEYEGCIEGCNIEGVQVMKSCKNELDEVSEVMHRGRAHLIDGRVWRQVQDELIEVDCVLDRSYIWWNMLESVLKLAIWERGGM